MAWCQDSPVRDNTQSVMITYFVFYAIIFGFLLDWLVISIFYRKSHLSSLQKHQSFMSLITISFITYSIVLLAKNLQFFGGTDEWVIDIVLISLAFAQFLLGIFTSTFMRMKNISPLIGVRWLHRINGVFFVLLAKAKLIIMVKSYMQDLPDYAFALVITWYLVLFVVLHIGIYCIYHIKSNKDFIQFNCSQWDHGDVLDLIQSVDQMEFFNYDAQNANKTLQKDEKNNSLPSTIFNDIQWCVFEEKVFDLSFLTIPCGEFIKSKSKRKDLTKVLRGEDIFLFNSGGKLKFYRHRHHFRTWNVLNSHCLGMLSKSKPFSPVIDREFFTECCDGEINLLAPAAYDYTRMTLGAVKRPEKFKCYTAYCFQLESNFILQFIGYIDDDLRSRKSLFDLDSYWLRNAGCYSLLYGEKKEVPIMDVARCFNPKYVRLRKKALLGISSEFSAKEELWRHPLIDRIAELPDEEEFNSFSRFYPVLGKKPESNFFGRTFVLVPDCGFPLPFIHTSLMKYLLIVKDSGIFRVLDFLEVLIQRILSTKSQTHLPWDLPNSDQILMFPNGISIDMIFMISEGFYETSRAFGLYQLYILKFLSNLVERIRPIIQSIFVVSPKFTEIDPILSRAERLEEVIDQVVFLKEYEKIVVSGRPEFKIELISKPAFSSMAAEFLFLI